MSSFTPPSSRGDESAAPICDGSSYCEAEKHVHGCFSDRIDADCDDRDQHDYWWKPEVSRV